MIRFLLLSILVLLIAWAFWRVLDGVLQAASGRPRRSRPPARALKLARDPICGTFVTPGVAVSLTRSGRETYFCSEHCRDEFVKGAPRVPRPHAS